MKDEIFPPLSLGVELMLGKCVCGGGGFLTRRETLVAHLWTCVSVQNALSSSSKWVFNQNFVNKNVQAGYICLNVKQLDVNIVLDENI